MIILGITGTIGAGKNTIVDYLKGRGFEHFCVRDFLIDRLKEQNLPADRDNMIKLANNLRREFGPAYIMEELYKRADKIGKNAVIESIRNLGEIEFLKSKTDFHLLAVDADRKTRFERISKRGSSTDAISYEKFVEQEEIESKGADQWSQNLPECIKLAEIVFQNNGNFADLYRQLDEYLSRIK